MNEGSAIAKPSSVSEGQERKRKKRCRKGIRDKRIGLPQDLLALIAPYVARTSGKSLLLLSMVNKFLHSHIKDSHDIWRTMYSSWEAKRPRSMLAVTIPNAFSYHPWPSGRPKRDDWRDHEMEPGERAVFNQYARKVMVLAHIKRCGICGTAQGNPQPYWSLGMSVCRFCWWDNTVSNRLVCLVLLE